MGIEPRFFAEKLSQISNSDPHGKKPRFELQWDQSKMASNSFLSDQKISARRHFTLTPFYGYAAAASFSTPR
jgi:hypothetical protein